MLQGGCQLAESEPLTDSVCREAFAELQQQVAVAVQHLINGRLDL